MNHTVKKQQMCLVIQTYAKRMGLSPSTFHSDRIKEGTDNTKKYPFNQRTMNRIWALANKETPDGKLTYDLLFDYADKLNCLKHFDITVTDAPTPHELIRERKKKENVKKVSKPKKLVRKVAPSKNKTIPEQEKPILIKGKSSLLKPHGTLVIQVSQMVEDFKHTKNTIGSGSNNILTFKNRLQEFVRIQNTNPKLSYYLHLEQKGMKLIISKNSKMLLTIQF